jgi:hypothetical protein
MKEVSVSMLLKEVQFHSLLPAAVPQEVAVDTLEEELVVAVAEVSEPAAEVSDVDGAALQVEGVPVVAGRRPIAVVDRPWWRCALSYNYRLALAGARDVSKKIYSDVKTNKKRQCAVA